MEQNTFPKMQRSIAAVVILFAVAFGSYYFGYQSGLERSPVKPIEGVSNLNQGNKENIDFSLFWEAWNLVKEKYVSAETVQNKDLVNGAISGLVESLKDPNSIFFPPSDAKAFSENISGAFSGIGAEIGVKNNQIVIVSPLKSSPAERAGFRPGDIILLIDSTSTVNMGVDEAVRIIRGPLGTTVKLTVLREGWKDPKEISITRETIQIPTLDWEMKSDGIAYVHLYNFYEQAPFLFYRAALAITAQNPRGIILDLRDNPGGYLDAGINIAGWFLKPGEVVVREEFRSGDDQTYTAAGSGIFRDIPVVVLINGGSASASEIVAGALRDDRGIQTVGTKSFGKGTVQELASLKDGSLLKITIAHWLTPNGQLIDKNGITPDFEVERTEDDRLVDHDPQLDKALEIMKSKITQGKLFGIIPQ